ALVHQLKASLADSKSRRLAGEEPRLAPLFVFPVGFKLGHRVTSLPSLVLLIDLCDQTETSAVSAWTESDDDGNDGRDCDDDDDGGNDNDDGDDNNDDNDDHDGGYDASDKAMEIAYDIAL
ncbi:hypothetical protein ElyMa_005153700, partial [Elysia marginata]